ncbi:hypothetical protein BGZ98_003678 [Dissophora globulifera]|nr:hypothetical protein BGZ98_003678 [Dissophora globulifera]
MDYDQKGNFLAAKRLVRVALQNRINETAQISLANGPISRPASTSSVRSASLIDQLYMTELDVERIQSLFHHSGRFNCLDLLSIGIDHIFIIHRELLYQDLKDYLANSPDAPHRVFVNVHHRLKAPEIVPKNRCEALEYYLRTILLPEMEHRIGHWTDAEYCNLPLPLPKTTTLVTVSGWLLNYPVIYVVPRKCHLEAARRLQPQSFPEEGEAGDESRSCFGYDDDIDDGDCGRNCLANQMLTVTKVQLEPNEEVEGLMDHVLLSFSYPSALAEMLMDRSSSPTSPLGEDRENGVDYIGSRDGEDDDDDENDEFVDAMDIDDTEMTEQNIQQNGGYEQKPIEPPDCMPRSVPERPYGASFGSSRSVISDMSEYYDSYSEPQPQANDGGPRRPSDVGTDRAWTRAAGDSVSMLISPSLAEQAQMHDRTFKDHPTSKCFTDVPKIAPPIVRNPDICAAGRSFLHQLHLRFQKQRMWKAWEVGQQTVTLPVVAI